VPTVFELKNKPETGFLSSPEVVFPHNATPDMAQKLKFVYITRLTDIIS
jgi:hypothetical protein